jgi:septum site-determining protein MinC
MGIKGSGRVTEAIAVRAQSSIRFRGRSFMAFALAPLPPLAKWLADLDQWLQTSPGFFVGRPIIADLAAVSLNPSEIASLIGDLGRRGIRIMGIEGIEAEGLDPSLPPVLKGGRAAGGREEAPSDKPVVPAQPASRQEPTSLLIENPIRSGQSVIFPYGDVTVLGSVSSGAEVVAGGSIHVYGTLRGRAMAGSMGDARARIFCSRNEAELISIDGFYRTAEEMVASLRSRPAQCWLEDRVLMMATLD